MSRDWSCYTRAFLTNAHQLLSAGYEAARDSITPEHDEPTITGLIVAAIRNTLDSPKTPEWWNLYDVHENPPENSNTGVCGKRRPLPDIVIRFAGRRPRLEFTCEAKRLKANSTGIGDYTGPDGLQCFLRGAYASKCPIGAMIGYVQSDSADRWFQQLSRKFDADSAGELQIAEGLYPMRVIPSLTNEWASEHKRDSNTPITVFHIFLNCCSGDRN